MNAALSSTPATLAEILMRPVEVGVKVVSAKPSSSVRGVRGENRPLPIVVRNRTRHIFNGIVIGIQDFNDQRFCEGRVQ